MDFLNQKTIIEKLLSDNRKYITYFKSITYPFRVPTFFYLLNYLNFKQIIISITHTDAINQKYFIISCA
jgi:hypothetical protein